MSAPAVLRRLVMIFFGLAMVALISHDVVPSVSAASLPMAIAGHLEEHRDPETFSRDDRRRCGVIRTRVEIYRSIRSMRAEIPDAAQSSQQTPIASALPRCRTGDVPHPPPRLDA